MAAAPRRNRQTRESKGDRRERALVETGERLLAAGQLSTTSVAEIAEQAGISRASFYFYFSSRESLLARIVGDAVLEFNARIEAVLSPGRWSSAAEALRATVDAAADLWWEHDSVLAASVSLGTTNPEVYAMTMANLELVAKPTVALLRKEGKVPEAEDEAEAVALVTALILMTERCFYDLMRSDPSRAALDRLSASLARIWLRAFGFEEP